MKGFPPEVAKLLVLDLGPAATIFGMEDMNISSRYDPRLKGMANLSSFFSALLFAVNGLFCSKSNEVTGGNNTDEEDCRL